MAVRSQERGRNVRATDENHRATPFELFFDLVYVFAITRITGSMAREHSALGVAQGLLTLALLWGTWSGYTWLGNHSRADQGLPRAGMVVAMAAMFVVGLAIPEAWADGPGDLHGPLVLVCAYLLVRWAHLTVYTVAAAGDTGLRRQIAITWLPMLAGGALLVSGALAGGRLQLLLYAVAVLVDWVGIYHTAKHGAWQLRSPAHLSERHHLFVILAIGESVVAVGVGTADLPVSTALVFAAVFGVAVAVCLWWLYFDVMAQAAEQRLRRTRGQARVRLAVDAYTYGHFPIIAGIVLAALGVEGVIAHAADSRPLGAFSALALYGGFTLYLGGHLLVERRMHHALSRPRLLAVCALLAAVPIAVNLPPLAGLAGLLAILITLIVVETIRYARPPDDPQEGKP
ncbi:low temperature requirement protein A [Acrocarpospora catenulata]|uniref:low temperature requirement protein A n=1 Tax=Acrocarpospora catenulata TaxID=2836182 RepID=UPI001BDA2B96|nr:low temperature requirement protein A [Acrocarpospora catenulata]